MAFDDDFRHVILILVLHQDAQVDREEAVQRIQTGLLDFRAVGIEKDVALQLDVAGLGVDGRGNVAGAQGLGQVADDPGADADQVLDLFLLGAQKLLQGQDVGLPVLQGLLLGRQDDQGLFELALLLGQVVLGDLQVFLRGLQLVLLHDDDAPLGEDVFLLSLQADAEGLVGGLLLVQLGLGDGQLGLLGLQLPGFLHEQAVILIDAVHHGQHEDHEDGGHHVRIRNPVGPAVRSARAAGAVGAHLRRRLPA